MAEPVNLCQHVRFAARNSSQCKNRQGRFGEVKIRDARTNYFDVATDDSPKMDFCFTSETNMRYTDFLVVLQNAMPPRAELEAYGLGRDDIESVQATFRFTLRNEPSSVSGSELERMILDNDCSNIEVGLIRFLEEPNKHRHGVQVAFCEADPIVVSPAGTVVLYDHANPDYAMNCAASSERFLDALGAFLIIRREKSKWKGRGNAAADLCAEKAGGGHYVAFFRMLCGFLA
jgi:hypothetical protein